MCLVVNTLLNAWFLDWLPLSVLVHIDALFLDAWFYGWFLLSAVLDIDVLSLCLRLLAKTLRFHQC